MEKKYKVTNTTVKPPNASGKDLRDWTAKQGHGVQFRSPQNDVVKVYPGKPRITDYVNEGMSRLQRGGFIRIDPINGVEEVLRLHAHNKDDRTSHPASAEEKAFRDSSHESATERPRVSAVEMGQDTTVARGEDHAVNPDGNPNFVVTANKNAKRKQRFATAEDTSAEESSV